MGDAPNILFVTGHAGAGHSTCLHLLEDFGFETIDNLPLPLLEALFAERENIGSTRLAIGIDCRTRGLANTDGIRQLLTIRNRDDVRAQMLFLECAEDVLLRRFQLARRPHPLHQYASLDEAIRAERQLLRSLYAQADTRIDTTTLSPAQLKDILAGIVQPEKQRLPVVKVLSFSYRHGLPMAADTVFDVRFLRNPFYDPALAPLTGRDSAVAAYIREDRTWTSFETALFSMLGSMLGGYRHQSRPYLTLAFGCSGGQHRSVFVAEHTGTWLAEQGWTVRVQHREGGNGHAVAGLTGE